MTTTKTYKIYSLKCPIDNNIRYIGSTITTLNNRLSRHISELPIKGVIYSKKMKWLQLLKSKRIKPTIELIEIAHTKRDRDIREQYWIDYFGETILYNGADADFNKNKIFKKRRISKNNGTTRNKELTEKIEIRVSEFEKHRIRWLANKYANGNVSLYLIYHGMNAPRKEIDPIHLNEYSKRRKKRP